MNLKEGANRAAAKTKAADESSAPTQRMCDRHGNRQVRNMLMSSLFRPSLRP